MKLLPLFVFLMLISIAPSAFAQSKDESPMTIKKMEKLLKKEVEDLEGKNGIWQMNYGGKLVLIVTDESANRMRIFSPVIEQEKMEVGVMEKMLTANFHSALDAKYSLYEGFVVSVFTHPLGELTSEQFLDALQQVVVLNLTYGTTFHSTDMIFNPGGVEEEPVKEAKPKEKKS